MDFDWQTGISLLIVSAAFVALVLRSFNTLGKAGACGGGCHGCGQKNDASPLVQIELAPAVERDKKS
jgi:hypothetical protein